MSISETSLPDGHHPRTFHKGGKYNDVSKAHPKSGKALLGGPQMVENSRDGKRVYFTNSLYSVVDDQFYPDRMTGWRVKLNVGQGGGMAFDEDFFVDFGETRSHQIRLEGGDASTDTFCYAS